MGWASSGRVSRETFCTFPQHQKPSPLLRFFITAPEIRDFNHLVTEITSVACRVYGQFVFSAQNSLRFLAKEWATLVRLLLCIVGSVLSVDPVHTVDGPGQFRTTSHDPSWPREPISACHEAVHILSCVESWCGF